VLQRGPLLVLAAIATAGVSARACP
jgi:hypothetical protein